MVDTDREYLSGTHGSNNKSPGELTTEDIRQGDRRRMNSRVLVIGSTLAIAAVVVVWLVVLSEV